MSDVVPIKSPAGLIAYGIFYVQKILKFIDVALNNFAVRIAINDF